MYCKKCGKKLDDSAEFCENCGTVINGERVSRKLTYEDFSSSSNESIYDDEYQDSDPEYSNDYVSFKDRYPIIIPVSGFVISIVDLFQTSPYGLWGLIGCIFSGIGFKFCLGKSVIGVVIGLVGFAIGLISFFIGLSNWIR